MQELQCVVHTYAWGKKGYESTVAQLKAAADARFSVDPVGTYAEYWMGTHPNGPSVVVNEHDGRSELLSEWLQSHPDASGSTRGDLPFLFKVLSVQKALSIQAHPDISLAKRLHTQFPDLYKDPNHKPEMAIAVTKFEALCQFRTIEEIVRHLQDVRELAALVKPEVVQKLLDQRDEVALREFFRMFVYCEQDVLATQLQQLTTRLYALPGDQRTRLDALVLRLYDEYSVDIGVFCPYLLNYIELEPGEAVFLGANEPHAYLSGDCIECMACSDNVVRAGLTPKFIDKVTLCDMLTYKTGAPSIERGERVDDVLRRYSPPVPEFEVDSIVLPANTRYVLPQRHGPSILLIFQGSGTTKAKTVRMGQVFFIAANEPVELESTSDGLVAFRASPNERVH